MTHLKESDLAGIRDEDLTDEQRKEIERRFQAFTRALAKAKAPRPATAAKTIAKWAPKQHRYGS